MISASKLTMRYGGKILFANTDLQLNPGQHYALIGANGSGKSTLIKLLSGDLTPEAGDIARPTQLTLSTLKQDHFRYEECKILDTVLMGKEKLWKALEARHQLLHTDHHFTEKECEILADLESKIAEHDGYSAESEAAQLLEGLGLPANVHEEKMKTLSGGYKLRVLLAQVLFSRPDILLLDEPTNHLDIFSIRWLEGYLKDFPGTLLISSHDKAFLNATCNYTVDIDYGTIKIYKGNYDQFAAAKELNRELKENTLEKHEKRRADLQDFVDRFGAKASKARQAQSKMHLVNKIQEEIDDLGLAASSRLYPTVRFEQSRPSGAIALTIKSITKRFGEKTVLEDISFEINRGEHIAVLGANGVGKSTLLEILTAGLKPDSGEIKWGHAAAFAYYPQDHAKLVSGNSTLLDWLWQFDRQASEQRIRSLLGAVLFTGDDVLKRINILSGGETARLVLAKMMLEKHNVLIFDEPTNHLDMEATEALIKALQNYDGTLIFVSHNRYFVSQLAANIIEITPQHGLLNFACTFDEYLAKREFDLLKPDLKTRKEKPIQEAPKSTQEDRQDRRPNKSQLTKKVAAAEQKCGQIEEKIRKLDTAFAVEGFYENTPKQQQLDMLKEKVMLEEQLHVSMQEWESASNDLQM